jgi:hypothetical protein
MKTNKDSKIIVIECENVTTADTLKYDILLDDNSYVDLTLMPEPKMAFSLLPGEHQDIRVDVNILLNNGNEWLATPNVYFGGRAPEAVIGTPDEALLRETLRSVIYTGMA